MNTGIWSEIVEELAKYSKVPVWNGLTNEYHPTQMLADMLIQEEFGHLKGIKLPFYMGDARYNMGNSLMIASAKMGMDFGGSAPKKYFPNAELVAQCEEYAKESGATITLTEDVKEGTKDADVIYTDVWVSMGEPDSVWEERIHDLTPVPCHKRSNGKCKRYRRIPALSAVLPRSGNKDRKEIHDRYGLNEMEVTDEVFESAQSRVFEEAENRMHTIKSSYGADLRSIKFWVEKPNRLCIIE